MPVLKLSRPSHRVPALVVRVDCTTSTRRKPAPPIGVTVDRLTVIGDAGVIDGHGHIVVRCSCGRELIISDNKIRRQKSCGCWRSERMGELNLRHGHSRTNNASPTWRSWESMLGRCRNPKAPDFARYGGRGITVCERWQVFDNFLADMGQRPVGTTLDRIDNEGNYEPANCRWATVKEQNRNKRTTRILTVDGVSRPLVEWSEISGLHRHTITERINRGWSLRDAVTLPSGARGRVRKCRS